MTEQEPSERRELTEAEFIGEMVRFFKTERALQLVGWCVLWGLQGRENLREWREELERQGITESGVYRALRDLRRFKEHLAERGFTFEGGEVTDAATHLPELVRKDRRTA